MKPTTQLFFNPDEKRFNESYNSNPKQFVQTLFYLRDKMRGLGLRRLFHQGFTFLVQQDPLYLDLLGRIPYYGSWKDLVVIAGLVPISVSRVAELFSSQLKEDLVSMKTGARVSTASKWYPSPRSSEGKSHLVLSIRQILKVNEADMRRTYLSPLRHYLGVVEIKMSAKEWSEIKCDKLTRGALQRYDRVLKRNDVKGCLFDVPPRPRSLVEAVSNILKGQSLGIDGYWDSLRGMRGDLMVPTSVICDTTCSRIELPITIALTLATSKTCEIYSHGNPCHYIPLLSTSSLALRVETLKTSLCQPLLSLDTISTPLVIVITHRPYSHDTKLKDDQQLIWWNVTGQVNLSRPGDKCLEITGFTEKIIMTLLKGRTLDLDEIVSDTLSRYPIALSYDRATA
jgi:hypothetical protein